MEKLKKITYKIVLIILLLLLLYVTYSSIFNIYQPFEKLNPIIIILGTIVIIFLLLRLNKLFEKIPDKTLNIIAYVLCFIFLVGLMIIGNNLVSIPLYDLSHLQKASITMIEKGMNLTGSYFQRYPNQVPSTIMVYFMYSLGNLFGISRLRVFGTCINAVLITITAFFTYLSAKEISNTKKALVALIFFIINPVFYLFVSYFYTDTLCMPFSAISIYLFIKAIKSDKSKTKILLLLLSGLFVAIGFKIRVVVAIFLIAIIVENIINKKLSKKIIFNTSYLLIGFVIGILACKLIEMPFNIEKNKSAEMPPTHWVMMGLNKEFDGLYNDKDYSFTRKRSGYTAKVEANIKQIKKRIKKLGIKNLVPFICTKLRVNWSNGEYFHQLKYLLANVEEITEVYHYTVGTKRIFSLYHAQICKSSIMIIVTIVVINEIRKKNKYDKMNQTILISIFGAFLFYLLWEVKPRYSLTFLPWFILLIPEGISTIENVELKRIKIPWQKIISISTIAVSICLIILNFNKYTINEKVYYDRKVHQERQNKMYRLSKNTIRQVFYTDKKFNLIQLRFYKKANSELTNYRFELFDSNENIIYEKDFNSDVLEEYDSNYSFRFNMIEPKNNEKYIIQVSSKEATDDNSIRLALFIDTINDVYPHGNAIINDEEKNGDIVFSVQEESKRTYVSKSIYITLTTVILLIELFAFYPYIFQNKKNYLFLPQK